MVAKNKYTIRFFGVALLMGLVPLLYSFLLSSDDQSLSNSSLRADEKDAKVPDYHRNITRIKPPEQLDIFGKRIPLEHWDVRERFDREFYYNYTNPDQLVLWTKRLKRWEPFIDSSLKANGLHPDFKYLMVAESGVRNVQSPAKAHGFWQFIPPTAQRYGLQVDDNIDERLDPIKATPAAIAFLSQLKAQFGDELLMAAAYNMGEYGLQAAMDNQKRSNYWNLYLNEETMRYGMRIAVIKEFMTHGDRYGFNFDRLEPYYPMQTQEISVKGPIGNIAAWALGQGYTYKDVKMYNPWIVGKSLPSGYYDIRLPLSDKDRATVDGY
ncbi:MAG TPA: lytic transglycosylase domain-containing protein [Candidatus Kapabacteria bacterium]